MAMLGEIVVHGEDIRRPLGLKHRPPEAALTAVADSWKNSNLLIGAKRRITGLRLRATDTGWAHGDGPEVSGPLLSLILAMTGRKAVLARPHRRRGRRTRPPGLNQPVRTGRGSRAVGTPQKTRAHQRPRPLRAAQ